MTSRLTKIAIRIRSELNELEDVLLRIKEGWERAQRSGDDYYLDGVALNLHSLYSGLERLFELIAVNVDGIKPDKENWHRELLKQMTNEVKQVRPAVISEESYLKLDIYRGFRHVVRNVYTINFDPLKVTKLVDDAPAVFHTGKKKLSAFADFL